jgi:plastocyanin
VPVKKLVVVSLAALALATAALAPAALAATQANVVHITALASGLKYDKKTAVAKAGKVTLTFTNKSTLHHNVRLEVGEKEFGGTKTIGKGTTTVVLTLKKGKYHFYCSVKGHEEAGMSGYLTVT